MAPLAKVGVLVRDRAAAFEERIPDGRIQFLEAFDIEFAEVMLRV